MNHDQVKLCENKERNFIENWECRYFVCDSEPPHGFEHERLRDIFDQWEGPRDESDLYFITDEETVNLKLRKSSKTKPTIKMRVRRDKRDEFELWRTEIDQMLPAPSKVWSKVLTRLNIEGDIDLLSNCSRSHQVEKVLLIMQPGLLHGEVRKKRWRYFDPQGEIEVAKITFGSSLFYSVSFESQSGDPGQVKALRDKWSVSKLGIPKNYVRLLSQVLLK